MRESISLPEFPYGMALEALRQLFLPMVAGLAATKEVLFGLVQQSGLLVMQEVFAGEAEKVAGPKGRHQVERRAYHQGSVPTEFPFAGRKVILSRPRVRGDEGGEVKLPGIEHLREVDPVCQRVVEQILLGVSTGGCRPSSSPLEAPPPGNIDHGTEAAW